MTLHHLKTQREKGKNKQLGLIDSSLTQLNELLENLLIPISLPDISVVTSSLLLAVIESILERRFLALNDSARTSRSPQSRSNCFKIILKVLNKYLDPIRDDWSPNSINFIKLIEGDPDEVVKLINGLLKLSKQSIFPHQQKDSSQNFSAPPRDKLQNHHHPQPPTSNTNGTSQLRPSSKRHPDPKQSISLSSNPSYQSSESIKTPFDEVFPPFGTRFDNPSSTHPSRAYSTNSSNSPPARLFNLHQQDCDIPITRQMSNPPTLRNLLGPLQAQFINSRRPQSPRTAHRVMVNKLRNEGNQDEIRDQILNHDTDTSLSTSIETEGQDETVDLESHYEYPKGSSMMMTLDGIEPDDPFVSMETRRAMESQLIQNQTTATFDFTQWAVAGDESDTFQLKKDPSSVSEWKQHSTLRGQTNKWSHSSESAAIRSSSASSHHSSEFDHSEDRVMDKLHGRQTSHSDLRPVLNASSSSKYQLDDRYNDLNTFTGDESSRADHHKTNRSANGFGKPKRVSSYSNSADFLPPNPTIPTSIPLPPSPPPSAHENSNSHTSSQHKISFASEGAQLNLIVADVISYEREKANETANMENSDWLDINKLSLHSSKVHSIPSSASVHNKENQRSTSSTKLNLASKKLELLRLLNQAYNNKIQGVAQEPYDDQSKSAKSEDDHHERSQQELEKIIEKENREKNSRIRVRRQPFGGIHQKYYDNEFDDGDRKINRLIVLNRFNLLANYSTSSNVLANENSSSNANGLDLNPEEDMNPTHSTELYSYVGDGDNLLDDVI